ncbi:hypothetical protein Tco_1028128, partial [Tanacetum coccineum]
ITSSPSLSPQTHSSTSQPPSTPPSNQTIPITKEAAPIPYELPLQNVQSLGCDEGSLSLNQLTDLSEEDPSNQGRSLIEELDLDAIIYLVPPHAIDQGRIDDTQIKVSTGSSGVSSASTLVSTADISTAIELDTTASVKAKDK